MQDLESYFPENNRAEKVYQRICSALEAENLKFMQDRNADGSLVAVSRIISDEFKLTLIWAVREPIDNVSLVIGLPFDVPYERRMFMAAGVCAVNCALFEGAFDYDINGGRIWFRLTENYLDAEIGEKQFRAMIFKSVRTVDYYGVRLRRLNEGIVTVQEFIDSVKGKK